MSLLRELLEARSAHALDLDDSGRVLLAVDDSGTFQLVEYAGSALRPLTALTEPVSGRYVPGSRRAVVAVDSGGNEQHQLYLLDLDAAAPVTDLATLTPLAVDPAVKHALGGASPDGRLVTYVSNARNGVDFDLYVHDLTTGEVQCRYDAGGYATPHGFSPDGRWVALTLPGDRSMDNDVLLVDAATGERRTALAHDDAAVVGAPAWLDADTYLVSSNAGRDLQALWHCDLRTGEARVVVERDHDVDCVTSADGSRVLLLGNADGATRVELLDGRTFAPIAVVPLPDEGVVAFTHYFDPPVLSRNGRQVALTFSSARAPAAAYLWTGGETAKRIAGQPAVDPARLATPTRHRIISFDGEQVPAFVFRPSGGDGPAPVVVFVHGGPEGQSTLVYNPVIQGLVDAGYAVVVPNVRGSTGYGKRWYGLDDTTKRLDSVRDLAAIHDWLPSVKLDPDRSALWGGSYGGYMVLAGVAFQPTLWAAGVDIVGISDLVTFLENTSPYRRAVREREYGSLAHDRDFLAGASPLRRVDDIVAPLFVIHGANDPRVPLSEAEQLVASLSARGIDTELLVYADEGHGLAKRANRLDAYPKAVAFLDRVLGR